MEPVEFKGSDPIAWCPGCGNFGILNAVKRALAHLGREPRDYLLVSGIGQAAKLPHYVKCNCFNGLHGRALPVAQGAKLANRDLTVLVTTGDGDCYGEGGNHFIHAVRRNVDITVIVHDNQIYGLTKGQASPTTDSGFETKVQTAGVTLEPLNPVLLAVALGCGFVARSFSKDIEGLSELIVEGVRHPGFSLIDVLQPCVSFNRKNTYEWYGERVYRVDEDSEYDPYERTAALSAAGQWGDRIPTGIIYRNDSKPYEQQTGLSHREPLIERSIRNIDMEPAFTELS
ncbi:MAG: 2-oxoacid ferredoxin oxidoreductase [Chitinivibrionales bacterium]|nr:2-oxoacid ferredoxin oxidoreductase [Chitinivibrionales bacterium]MBD3397447.1 2-oxoacid ferredoxin oxidoreductase [Chitinivibrionales bacterium]